MAFDQNTSKMLANALLRTILGYQRNRPHDRDTFFEVLAALAYCAALLVKSVGKDRNVARDWFWRSFHGCLKDIPEPRSGEQHDPIIYIP